MFNRGSYWLDFRLILHSFICFIYLFILHSFTGELEPESFENSVGIMEVLCAVVVLVGMELYFQSVGRGIDVLRSINNRSTMTVLLA